MSEPLRVEVAGEPLRCQHCGADVFFEESATLDRLVLGGLSHLEGQWGHQATIYVCSACGSLHWFFAFDTGRHQRADAEEMAERVECLSCGESIPAGASACPACGWSWESAGPAPAGAPIAPQIAPRSTPQPHPLDPRLAAVIDAWDRLPEAIRAGIMAMIGVAPKD